MGNHYIPQYYLHQFCDDKKIWVHDLQQRRTFRSVPKSVANENRMYPQAVEQLLAKSVEEPARPAIEKAKRHEPLERTEREALALYAIALWKRVPRGRLRFAEHMPAVASALRADLHQELDELAEKNPDFAHLKSARKKQIDEALERYARETPNEIWQASLARIESTPVAESALSMRWQFLVSNDAKFVTCDNPVFVFEAHGVGHAMSELTIPLSSSVCLWAHRKLNFFPDYLDASIEACDEINRRTVYNATRYVFSAKREDWVFPLVCAPRQAFNYLL